MNSRESPNYWPGTTELTKPARYVAKVLGVHPNTLFHWVKIGKISCIRYGSKSIRFTYDQILEFLENSRDNLN